MADSGPVERYHRGLITHDELLQQRPDLKESQWEQLSRIIYREQGERWDEEARSHQRLKPSAFEIAVQHRAEILLEELREEEMRNG